MKNRSSRGFITMIEVMIIFAIIGNLLAVAVPAYIDFKGHESLVLDEYCPTGVFGKVDRTRYTRDNEEVTVTETVCLYDEPQSEAWD